MEGSTLTFLGLIKYNAETDSFAMTSFAQMVSGGISMTRQRLNDSIDYYERTMWILATLGFFTLSFGGVLHWMVRAHRRREQEILDAEAKSQQLEADGGAGSTECFICMERVATEVYVPCNHMLACQQCTERIKITQNPKCPLCQRVVDFGKSFRLLKLK